MVDNTKKVTLREIPLSSRLSLYGDIESYELKNIAESLYKKLNDCGGVPTVERLTGIPHVDLYRWRDGKGLVPIQRAVILDRATCGYIQWQDLRPDIAKLFDDEEIKLIVGM